MFKSAGSQLERYPDNELGISMGKLVNEVQRYAEQLFSFESKPIPYRDLIIEIEDLELKQAVKQAASHIKPNIPQRRKPERARPLIGSNRG